MRARSATDDSRGEKMALGELTATQPRNASRVRAARGHRPSPRPVAPARPPRPSRAGAVPVRYVGPGNGSTRGSSRDRATSRETVRALLREYHEGGNPRARERVEASSPTTIRRRGRRRLPPDGRTRSRATPGRPGRPRRREPCPAQRGSLATWTPGGVQDCVGEGARVGITSRQAGPSPIAFTARTLKAKVPAGGVSS